MSTRASPQSQSWAVPANLASAEMDDQALLRRACAGDQRALDMLCRRCWKPVYRSLAKFTQDPAEAEDLTQEVFLRALRALPQFEDRGLPFASYLLRIARNLASDRWRAGRARVVVTQELPERSTTGPGPESLAIESARRQTLLAALDRLAPDHASVLRLRVLEGRPSNEVATLIRRSPQAVRQLQVRALAALRELLTDELGNEIADYERGPR